MKYSQYQIDVFNTIQNTEKNIVIKAVAGSGKTTTIVGCLDYIPNDKDTIFFAFNNHTVEDLRKKVNNKYARITTFHSFGWQAVRKHYGSSAQLNPNKNFEYIEKICKKHKIKNNEFGHFLYVLSKAYDLKRFNMCFDYEELVKICDKHSIALGTRELELLKELEQSISKDFNSFDFTDMIYLTAANEQIKLPKYDFIFLDESQDLSICQQRIVKRILKSNGRLISVGDPNQAIYGFAGADIESYNKLLSMYPNTVELPLTVSYRCSKNVVKFASKINPDIKPYSESPQGTVQSGSINSITQKDWVLCRNLKPLVLLNLYLLSKHKKSYIKGKEIGTNLLNMIDKQSPSDVRDLMKSLYDDLVKQIAALKRTGFKNPQKTVKITNFMEKIDVIKILSRNINTISQLKQKIKSIFSDNNEGICLMTIHKSKGSENDKIFILCPELIPNKFAVADWEKVQERNLEYVAYTRAKKDLVFIDDYEEMLSDFRKSLIQ